MDNPIADARRQQIEEHHPLALRYAERVRAIDLGSAPYSPPPSDDVRDWPPVLQWAAYEARFIYHSDICTALEMGRGPFYCAGCSPLKQRPKGWKLMLCWPCWWDAYAYDDSLRKARAISQKRWAPPSLRPTEVL